MIRSRGPGASGEPAAKKADNRITVNSFLAEGGDDFTVLRDATERTGGGLDLDALWKSLRASSWTSAVDGLRAAAAVAGRATTTTRTSASARRREVTAQQHATAGARVVTRW